MNNMQIRPCGPGYMYCDGRCGQCEYNQYYTTYTTNTVKTYEQQTAHSVTSLLTAPTV